MLHLEYFGVHFESRTHHKALDERLLEVIPKLIPSIRYMELQSMASVSMAIGQVRRWWEIVRKEGVAGHTLREISEDTGQLIKQRYVRDASF
jgi:hypothetical protein